MSPTSNFQQGRSAYEPVQSAEPHNWTKAGSAEPSEDVPYPQSYDNKGNPISIKTVRRSAAQIAAKNEVLAAVGVCEKKNNEARLFSSEGTYSEEEWKSIRVAENSVEFVGRVMAAISRHGATWWLVALRRRVQVSLYPRHRLCILSIDTKLRLESSGAISLSPRYLPMNGTPSPREALGAQLAASWSGPSPILPNS